jgi:hypothetical protein
VRWSPPKAGMIPRVAAGASVEGRARGTGTRESCRSLGVEWSGCRGVAQPGRALGSGPRGRRFKSSRPDHNSSAPLQRVCSGRSFWRAPAEAPFFCSPSGRLCLSLTACSPLSRGAALFDHDASSSRLGNIAVTILPRVQENEVMEAIGCALLDFRRFSGSSSETPE